MNALSPDEFFGSPQTPQQAAPAAGGVMAPEDFFGAAPPPPQAANAQPDHAYKFQHFGPLADMFNAESGFKEQFGRAITMGLQDKVGATVPVINQAVLDAWHKLTGQSGQNVSDLVSGQAQPSYSDLYHGELAKERGAGEAYSENHPAIRVGGVPLIPGASGLATTLGSIASIPATGTAGLASGATALGGRVLQGGAATTLPGRMLQGAGQGALVGGTTGFGNSNDESAIQTLTDTGIGTGLGAAMGGAVPFAGEKLAQPALDFLGRKFGSGAVDNQAAQQVAKYMKPGGPTAQDMLDLQAAHASGTPLTIADVGGGEMQNRLGQMLRQPGDAREFGTQFLLDRDKGAGSRLAGAVDTNISNGGTAFDTNQALLSARSAAGAPLYEQAFQGGSTAPLEDQLRTSLQAATGAKGQITKQIAQIENDSPGALAARGAAGADIRARYMDLHSQLQQAEQDRLSTLDMFQKAQSDGAMNAPGAVWNPRIQQFLDDPVFRGGLKKGMEIQRLEALAAGKPFNPSEYAITGIDQAGNPVVGNVPNMRLLDAGKKGLDAIIQGERNSVTGKLSEYGRAVDQVRRSYLGQLDQINPDYAAARAAWSGPSSSMDAVQQGQTMFGRSPSEISHEFSRLSPNDQEFYRLGAADSLKRSIAKTGMGGDEAKRIIGNQDTQDQLRAIFPTQDGYNKFIQTATNENRIFNTKYKAIGGSETGARVAQDAAPPSPALGHAVQTAMSAGEGALGSAAFSAMRMLGALMSHGVEHPEVNAAATRLMLNTDPAAQKALLAKILASQSAPALAPSLGRPLVTGAAQGVPALLRGPQQP